MINHFQEALLPLVVKKAYNKVGVVGKLHMHETFNSQIIEYISSTHGIIMLKILGCDDVIFHMLINVIILVRFIKNKHRITSEY